jgi:hypothetical protein
MLGSELNSPARVTFGPQTVEEARPPLQLLPFLVPQRCVHDVSS